MDELTHDEKRLDEIKSYDVAIATKRAELETKMRNAAVVLLKGCQGDSDIERAHRFADKILTHLLWQLGYDDVAKAWRKVQKHYDYRPPHQGEPP